MALASPWERSRRDGGDSVLSWLWDEEATYEAFEAGQDPCYRRIVVDFSALLLTHCGGKLEDLYADEAVALVGAVINEAFYTFDSPPWAIPSPGDPRPLLVLLLDTAEAWLTVRLLVTATLQYLAATPDDVRRPKDGSKPFCVVLDVGALDNAPAARLAFFFFSAAAAEIRRFDDVDPGRTLTDRILPYVCKSSEEETSPVTLIDVRALAWDECDRLVSTLLVNRFVRRSGHPYRPVRSIMVRLADHVFLSLARLADRLCPLITRRSSSPSPRRLSPSSPLPLLRQSTSSTSSPTAERINILTFALAVELAYQVVEDWQTPATTVNDIFGRLLAALASSPISTPLFRTDADDDDYEPRIEAIGCWLRYAYLQYRLPGRNATELGQAAQTLLSYWPLFVGSTGVWASYIAFDDHDKMALAASTKLRHRFNGWVSPSHYTATYRNANLEEQLQRAQHTRIDHMANEWARRERRILTSTPEVITLRGPS